MRHIAEANFLCWDFSHLVHKTLTKTQLARHIDAFHSVLRQLKPSLNILLPQGPEFGFVHTQWPCMKQEKPTKNGWSAQYKTLCRRLRAAAKLRSKYQGWWRVSRVVVEPVLDCGPLLKVSKSEAWPQFQHISQGHRACLLFLIRQFLCDSQKHAARPPFPVELSSLMAVGTKLSLIHI